MKVFIIELQGKYAANGTMAVAANDSQEALALAMQQPAYQPAIDNIRADKDSHVTELPGVRSGRKQPTVLYKNYNPY